jgi:hypothetical protein
MWLCYAKISVVPLITYKCNDVDYFKIGSYLVICLN